ncbi:GntR family transcriptional regulator [Hydrogenophaga sp. A37]|uniref:GntR family transcriptional regulator n=1 Tax=Hydrogenophaga sp. A37 TaxID=1945864 RepID=UPI0009873299|nr:GntR family transcriptional regulator [Hydrogenophaga sp. A37]OOG84981.1 GntR family transcriptional regulator [Hydrogenophaga sp. A37]
MSAAPGRSQARVPSLRVQAYENFREQIVRAQIRPGQFISQRELMQLLGMPLGAVRELIPRLEAEGLLQTVPQRGLQVAQVDLKLIRNAFELRLLLERESAIRFAQEASDAELARIEDEHRAIVERARTGPIDEGLLARATQVDWGLHEHMIDAMGNALISEIYRINSLRVRLIKFENSSLSADILLAAMEEHLWFIEALRRRDTTAVAERLGHHIESARRRVLGLPRPTLPWSSQTATP